MRKVVDERCPGRLMAFTSNTRECGDSMGSSLQRLPQGLYLVKRGPTVCAYPSGVALMETVL